MTSSARLIILPASEWKSLPLHFLSRRFASVLLCCDRHRPGLAFQTNEAPNTPSSARRAKGRFPGCAHATLHPHTHLILVSIPAAQSLQTGILGAALSRWVMVMVEVDAVCVVSGTFGGRDHARRTARLASRCPAASLRFFLTIVLTASFPPSLLPPPPLWIHIIAVAFARLPRRNN